MADGTGLAVAAHWPLRIQALAALPDAATLGATDAANRTVLRALLALAVGDAGDDGAVPDDPVARVEAKLDAVLDLLAGMLAAAAPLPPAVALVLAADRLEWAAPAGAGPVCVELYPDPRYPRALRLYGIAEPTEAGGGRLPLAGLAAASAEVLTRLVFVLHRRAHGAGRRARASR
ncbi:atypical PilZ domain-containing cyclic di-GMP receptor [Plasticicumulans lactativorans]|uniref:Atypical PilZ domain-containing cyclic di-GMP receptor n=1 Tax=Plasticicumulans lactativorans TaxID=1133106 RepID=A0A4R2LA66_9GAMM|nr:hypothetical protein [Plasticicumulans lactativorans]TCO81076.1 atypical PilZ domain-containing cyclic di-GMP receptor [Plasticicumulans lactativorans]